MRRIFHVAEYAKCHPPDRSSQAWAVGYDKRKVDKRKILYPAYVVHVEFVTTLNGAVCLFFKV